MSNKSRHPHSGGNGPTSNSNDNLSARAQGTWPQQRSSKAQRAAKAARVHTLTDPLGAKGFRATGARIRNETSARRKVLLASVATFAASFGVIVATNHTPANADPAATTNQPAASTTNSQATSSNGSSVGSALDLFSGQTANGLTSSTSSTTTTTKHHDDGGSDDNENNSNFLTTQPNSSSSSQVTSSNSNQTTTNQTNQSSLFVQQPVSQQPSHTRSGGS